MNGLNILEERNKMIESKTDFTTDLVAGWKLNNDFTDWTGNHDLAKVGTVNFVNGIVNKCGDFPGGSEYLTLESHTDFNFTDGVNDIPFSIATWVKFDVIQNSVFLGKRGGFWNNQFEMRYTGTQMNLRIFDNDDNNQLRVLHPFTANTGQWYLFGFTSDGSQVPSAVKGYLDGLNVGTSSEAGTYVRTRASTAGKIRICNQQWAPTGNNLNGKQGPIKIWKNRVITPTEFLELESRERAGEDVLI